jgi:D-alanyl-D-alanine carboxypeptidase
MKQIFLTAIVVQSMVFAIAQSLNSGASSSSVGGTNAGFSKSAGLQTIMDRYTAEGLPGVSMAVFSESEGLWRGSAGFAQIESRTAMQNSNLQYLQSISKTYMAVAILKLYEQGKIDLEAPVSRYLPSKLLRYVKAADRISIKMLLNHTSGVPEYSSNPAFVSYVLLHPKEVFNIEAALRFVENEPLQFSPGSKYKYCNTNYLLLAVVADKITGDHATYINEIIFKMLGLKSTYYRSSKGYLRYPDLVDSYWDVLNTGKPANITALQQANVATLKGDDGIVCTTEDAILFLKGLMEGKLLNDSSLNLMKQWVNDDSGKPAYGLGLTYYEAGGLQGYGHSGGGIGAGCILLYVPEKKLYVFIATNVGTLFGGTLAKKASDMKDEILGTLLF